MGYGVVDHGVRMDVDVFADEDWFGLGGGGWG